MNFSLKRVLISVAAICVFVAAVARGEFLLGSIGILFFAFLASAAIFLTLNLLHKWQAHSLASRLVIFIFVGFVGYTLVFPKNMWPDYHYFAQTRQWQRTAIALQYDLADEHEYQNVVVKYNAPPNSKSEFLDVRGDVIDMDSYDRLVNRVKSMDSWYVMWSVTIDGEKPPDPVD